jgi:hypothetical protein
LVAHWQHGRSRPTRSNNLAAVIVLLIDYKINLSIEFG